MFASYQPNQCSPNVSSLSVSYMTSKGFTRLSSNKYIESAMIQWYLNQQSSETNSWQCDLSHSGSTSATWKYIRMWRVRLGQSKWPLTDKAKREAGRVSINGGHVGETENWDFQFKVERPFVWTIAVTPQMLRKELWDSCCHIRSHVTFSGSLSLMQWRWRHLLVVSSIMLTEIFIVWSQHSFPTRKTAEHSHLLLCSHKLQVLTSKHVFPKCNCRHNLKISESCIHPLSLLYCVLFITLLCVFQVCGRRSSSRHSSCWWEQR